MALKVALLFLIVSLFAVFTLGADNVGTKTASGKTTVPPVKAPVPAVPAPVKVPAPTPAKAPAPAPIKVPTPAPVTIPAPVPVKVPSPAPVKAPAPTPLTYPAACPALCVDRCAAQSRKNVCKRACETCCARCKCVPLGTSGNYGTCGKCYFEQKTHGGQVSNSGFGKRTERQTYEYYTVL
ncbi:hypothetical protein C5167_006416 [Papaver somniferum]|uniref:Gibberellin regulated protein n=1 Tax=Papaver somniferum TaxID=3469 RepID=A0A4Y7JGD1_PAPSO|nr:gibberellin-regulated protein 14-like isoform X1 [Papaver somniferum]RZC59102.1 hypothetical protein C5167_006416 [Papaver somniferum]